MLEIKASPGREEVRSAHQDGRLLLLWLEVWPYCHLNCRFCFNSGGSAVAGTGWLAELDYLRTLEEFASLGGKYIGIPGYGEPSFGENRSLTLCLLREAKRLGIQASVFTSGDLLDEELVETLCSLDVSLMVKFNSFDQDAQDALVGRRGYSRRRAKCLERLYRLGFNRPEPDRNGRHTTRLGFVTSILPENLQSIPDIWDYCERHNIFADIDTILPQGRGQDLVSIQGIENVSIALTEKPMHSPTYICKDGKCERTRHGLYMDYRGTIFPCLGCKDVSTSHTAMNLGSLRDGGLAAAWSLPLMEKIRRREYSGKCVTCSHFQSGECNSCFGRCFGGLINGSLVMNGCPFFSS